MQAIEFKYDADSVRNANQYLKNLSPKEIVEWAHSLNKRSLVTTNFRPYEGAILHACVSVIRAINVVWCDTGYNTPQTYICAERLIDDLQLNIDLFVPKQTVAHRDLILGVPAVEDEKHKEFTYQVKLEPFQRAMAKHEPELWFTNLRKGQTNLRDSLDIISLSKTGILKVSPFYYWSDTQLAVYMEEHQLANEHKYYDPTKALENRECGLHQ